MLLLDTSALSAIMHRVPGALERLGEAEARSVLLSSPVAAEIHYGLENLEQGSKRRRILEDEYLRFRETVRWVDWTESAARQFGVLKADLKQRGLLIEDMDLAISSIALTLNAVVATRNVRHFERIEGLKIEDWRSL